MDLEAKLKSDEESQKPLLEDLQAKLESEEPENMINLNFTEAFARHIESNGGSV